MRVYNLAGKVLMVTEILAKQHRVI